MTNWKNLVTYIYTKRLEVKVYIKREVGLEANPNSKQDHADPENAKKFLVNAFGFDILDILYMGCIGNTTHAYELFVRSDQ